MNKEEAETVGRVYTHTGGLLNKIKEPKGSITLFVLVTCMFMITVLLLVNISIMNKNASSEKELAQITKNYSVNETDLANQYAKIADENDYITRKQAQEMIDDALKKEREEIKKEITTTETNLNQNIDQVENTLRKLIDTTNKKTTTELTDLINTVKSELSTTIMNEIQKAKTQVKLEAFPVGSIFISNTPTNPSTYIGGTWESYGQGRTLIGAGTGTDSNNTSQLFRVGAMGGEYNHTLTIAEMPNHRHDINASGDGTFEYSETGTHLAPIQKVNASNWRFSFYTVKEGGNAAHNNIQPYIVTYMWKRTK